MFVDLKAPMVQLDFWTPVCFTRCIRLFWNSLRIRLAYPVPGRAGLERAT